MNINKNSVVSFHYSLVAEPSGQTESSSGDDPVLYMHGHRGIVRGLEQAMAGRAAGDRFQVDVSAIDGYGMRDESLLSRMPAKYLKHEKKLKPGKQVQVSTEKGNKWVTVIKVGKFSVDVDGNHPLAGQGLKFSIDVVDVREASADEISHGHAHGPGGHHHDH